jgi:hypothetical protein
MDASGPKNFSLIGKFPLYRSPLYRSSTVFVNFSLYIFFFKSMDFSRNYCKSSMPASYVHMRKIRHQAHNNFYFYQKCETSKVICARFDNSNVLTKICDTFLVQQYCVCKNIPRKTTILGKKNPL